ncbi:hypothetical protein EJ02DRAFT_378567 [Clathrospora elynae]|uniref:N-acetyltransferase domain-containing protein n=1 Tax=Clathrospora elynae TaxID=706981 RepID=A0A6A5SNM9_9PLEO|nr:hypothetical protein EJ02DRAFT_378567 [Clathrospora elynae]
MATPNLSSPILFSPDELKSNPDLSASVLRLVNNAFYRSKESNPIQWCNTTLRFPNEDALHTLLSPPNSVIALIFDMNSNVELPQDLNPEIVGVDKPEHKSKKIVACAAAVPWKGGWAQEGAGTESGWEIKIVSVDGDAKYLRRGLAVQILEALEHRLVSDMDLHLRKEAVGAGEATLTLWILAAESLTGAYWRKKGYREVRKKIEGAGVWSCKTSFEMVVFRKDVRV